MTDFNLFTAGVQLRVEIDALSAQLKQAENMCDASAKKIEATKERLLAKERKLYKIEYDAYAENEARKEKLLKKGEKSFGDRIKSMQTMMTYFSAALAFRVAVPIVQGFLDMGTAMHKAAREGGNVGRVFAESIPVVGVLVKSLNNLNDELSGEAEIRERLAKFQKNSITDRQLEYEIILDSLAGRAKEIAIIEHQYELKRKQLLDSRQANAELKAELEAQLKIEEAFEQTFKNWQGDKVEKNPYSKKVRNLKEQIIDLAEKTARANRLLDQLGENKEVKLTPAWVSQVEIPSGTFSDDDYTKAMAEADRWNTYELKLAQKTADEAESIARDHINWLRGQDNMSLDQKIENLNAKMEYLQEYYGYQMDAEKLLADERKRYQEQNVKDWDAVGMAIENHFKQAMDWGKNLGNVLCNAFDSAAESFADMLMKEEVDWKEFSRAFVKELLVMIIRLEMAAALKAALGSLGGGYTPTPSAIETQAGFLASLPSSATAADGGYVDRSGLAVIHKGETVTPAGGGNVTVNVNNQAGVQVDVDNYMQSDQRIIDVTLRAAAGNGTYQRSHGLRR